MIVLRPYQVDAVTQIRQHAARGGQGAILQLATGAGKTACFCDVLKGAYAKGKCALMVVRGKQLVHQASERLTRENVPHGIYQGEKTKNTHEKILVASIDTLYSRRIAPIANLLVIDECHLAHSEGYRWLMASYPNVFRIGVSATPHHKDGMRHIADTLIRTASITDLIRDGYLVGARYFVPYVPDLRGVKKVSGDFNGKELSKRSTDDAELTASAAKVWSGHLRGKSTLVYATSVEHANVLAACLRGAGARIEIILANTPDGERRDYIGRLEDGSLDALVSVGVLTTGVDIPSLRAILCCRPTKSYNLWIQILGRATRPFPGKEAFECYDLSGNLIEHGPIEAELVADLDGFAEQKKLKIKTCPACYATFESGPTECPVCGQNLVETRERVTGKRVHGLTDNEEIWEIKTEAWELELPGIIERAKLHGHRKGAIYHLMKAKYGAEIADKAWPRVRTLRKWALKTQVEKETTEQVPDSMPVWSRKS